MAAAVSERFVLSVLTLVSLAYSQQLTQGKCPYCLLACCVSMCLLVCEKGPGPVISQIYYSSSNRGRGSVAMAGRGGYMGWDIRKLSMARSLGACSMCEDVCNVCALRSAPRPQPTDDVHA